MKVNSRDISLLLSISISAITSAFLSLVEGVPVEAILVAFLISFSSAYIFSSVMLDFIFFREINKINDTLNTLKYRGISTTGQQKSTRPFINPLGKLKNQISNYAADKQQEIEDLKRLEAFRREFLADVSHELKTPIFAAQGFVHTLLDGAVEDKKIRYKFLKKAARSLDGLDILVHDLLTLSQMERGEIKMHREEFDLLPIIADTIEQFEDTADKRNIRLVANTGNLKQAFTYADPRRINQVLTNLISNAVKYSRKGSLVSLSVVAADNEYLVSVEDEGKGISAEHLNRIFERFYRVEKSRSKNKGGTGLGLAIVKHILEAHETTIAVKSELNKGSVFQFKLPLVNTPLIIPASPETSVTEKT